MPTTMPALLAATSLEALQPLQLTGDFLYLGILFIIFALVAGLLGARGIAGLTMEVARWFIIIFIVLAIISLVL